jgi:cell division protein ZapE
MNKNFFNDNMILDPIQKKLSNSLLDLQTKINNTKKSRLTSIFKKNFNYNLKGKYIYGPVGCGKSTLMEIFFQELNTKKKLLIHFHEFMQNIHSQIFQIRQKEKKYSPITVVARKLAQDYEIICLDELEINDITDAMIVGKLFNELLDCKVIIITTSNRHPDELYQDGLQRAKFLEFIEVIKQKLDIVYVNNYIDYRLSKISAKQQVFFIPNNKKNQKEIDKLFQILCENHPSVSHIINFKGRDLTCNHTYKNIAKFTFEELCLNSLGPADYIAICKQFRVIIVTDIPKLSAENNNELMRFINLVDEIYEHSILLICSVEVPFEQLYTKGRLEFKYQRVLSRLSEMQSEEYVNKIKNLHL